MIIQWFPGHMNKALNTLEDQLKIVDVVVYVLDARAAKSCFNPEFRKRIKNKPVVYVLNKCDLIEKIEVEKWLKYFNTTNSVAVSLNSTTTASAKVLVPIIENLAIDKITKYKNKGINVVIRAVVIGVPNCGKSTLINNLCGKYKATTGNKAGVTRGKQWVKISSKLEVLDMPGTLWPSFEDDNVAHNLAYIGSIRDEVLDLNELAYDFIAKMKQFQKSALEDRYAIEIDNNEDTLEIFDKICLSRGFLLKNKEFDYERCSKAIIDDFRKGRMGKIILERA